MTKLRSNKICLAKIITIDRELLVQPTRFDSAELQFNALDRHVAVHDQQPAGQWLTQPTSDVI